MLKYASCYGVQGCNVLYVKNIKHMLGAVKNLHEHIRKGKHSLNFTCLRHTKSI